jgi:nuclear GTP-binding protein
MPKQRLRLQQGTRGRLPRSSTDPDRGNVQVAGSGWGRTRAVVKRLRMYARPAYTRDRSGRICPEKGDLTSSVVKDPGAGRVAPNRRWFGNTRTIDQEDLQSFREGIASAERDPYTYVLRQRHLPWALIKEGMERKDVEHYEQALGTARIPTEVSKLSVRTANIASRALLRLEPFSETFHQQRWRKRPRLAFDSIEELAERVCEKTSDLALDKSLERKKYPGQETAGIAPALRTNSHDENDGTSPDAEQQDYKQRHERNKSTLHPSRHDSVLPGRTAYTKGQSRRIWSELYKVIDASDVVLFVLDARDPLGTRIPLVEDMLRREHPHKHLAFVLNKCDLVPKWVTGAWLRYLSRECPTVAFRANDCKRSFGRGALIRLLRQFSRLHRKDRQSISCGIIGYPNVGKSSIINALKKEKVVRAAPIPGETKVWQYVTLFRRVYLVDCPGVVHARLAEHMDTSDMVLRGVIRVESLRDDAERHIARLMQRVDRRHLEMAYAITWSGDHVDAFLDALARARGKLLPGGEPDRNGVAKMVINDFIRGRLPWYVPPPPSASSTSALFELWNKSSGIVGTTVGANTDDQEITKELPMTVQLAREETRIQDHRASADPAVHRSFDNEKISRVNEEQELARPMVENAEAILQALSNDENDEEDEWENFFGQETLDSTSVTTTERKTGLDASLQNPRFLTCKPVTGETESSADHRPRQPGTVKSRSTRLTKRARRISEWNSEPTLQANLQHVLSRTRGIS